MKLKLFLESIAKDMPDFDWIKEDLMKELESLKKMSERDRTGVASSKVTKIHMKLNKDGNNFVIKELIGRNATYNETTKKIAISKKMFDDIRDALSEVNKEELETTVNRLIQALTHEYTHLLQQKSRKEKGNDFDFNTKGLNQISTKGLDGVSVERLKGLITLYNDQNYLSDTQEVGAFAVQIAKAVKQSGKSINDYLADVLNIEGLGKGKVVRDYKALMDRKLPNAIVNDEDPDELIMRNKMKKAIGDGKTYKRFLRKVYQAYQDLK